MKTNYPRTEKKVHPVWSSRCGLIPGQYDPHLHLPIPRKGRACLRPGTRPQAPGRMTARSSPRADRESPEGLLRSRSPARHAHLRGPRRPVLPTCASSPLTPRSPSSHHSVHSCSAPPSLSVSFLLPTPGVECRARLKMPAGSTPLRPRPHPTPGVPGSLRITRHRARPPPDPRPSDRSPDPARKDLERLARAYTSPARSGANVGTSAPSGPTPPACARRRPAPRPQPSQWDRA